ncbi:MAG TPA: adenosylcobinamide amidohydrolase, partial [Pilimelia sp.]|nr:adenosylcobinamide amidohydrolase [Pilimelia sp.]
MEPTIVTRREDGRDLPLLLWRLPIPMLAISSAALGGGIGVRHWVVNATVPVSYDRDDPDVHLADLAARLDLTGPGVGLLTGVDVARVVSTAEAGMAVWATVGLDLPTWAAVPASPAEPPPAEQPPPGASPHAVRERPPAAGTINVVAVLPARLGDAALVNAIATVAEAKAQALWELGLPGTGTPSDATCVLCPT